VRSKLDTNQSVQRANEGGVDNDEGVKVGAVRCDAVDNEGSECTRNVCLER